MSTFNFTKWNKILGWAVFAIALCVYSMTVEPTASFWDAGEYIATSSKLQVGHPPGAPIFQMIGAFASAFASDPTQIALMVNLTSAFASAFAILFMFWSITILVKKLIVKDEEFTQGKAMAVLGSALVGSLAFTFTDSFWFNAVEAEVYAMATCILSVLFYLGLLWERDMHTPRGNKWLILISFIVGLSFGVHFMGLLSIPAIGLLYYFKNYKEITVKNFIIANVVVVAILLFIFKLLLPSTLKFFGAAEVFFVNSIGLPFNSGTIIAGLIMIAAFYFGIKHTRKQHYPQLNTLLLCVMFILIGFSSWIMLPVRANAGTVINENNPNNARELLAYYNLEQYPETHLFYGPQFTEIYAGLDENNPYEDDKPKYEKDLKTGKYIIVNDWKNAKQNLDNTHKALLPRMWSTEHIANYMEFTGPIKFTIKPEYQDEDELLNAVTQFRREYASGKLDNEDYHKFLQSFGNYLNVKKPSLWDNVTYLFDYQMGYMYWRYFMWNFAGRQDDNQGKLTNLEGNWLSGIKFIDEARLGSQDNLPSDALKNKARNTYYFLPLLLGLIGFVFMFQRDKKYFWILLVFFLFTGLALKIYLNERPFEPRERDYALVGSFYVFAIWIGFGVYALFDVLKDYLKPKLLAPIVTGVCLLAVPVLLAAENWDDHDRSNRYTAQSMAKMYLQSCQKDAILFTIGDNDTFALWYAQDIEGYRTDVRTVNTSLFATDWYIDQMKKAAYNSKPIPSQLTHEFYRWGNNDAIYYKPVTNDTMLIKNWMRWIETDDPRTKGDLSSGKKVNTFPTKHIRIPVNKEAVLRNGIVSQEDADLIVPYIDIHLKGDLLFKNRLLMLDMIANNDWERPIYFTGGSYGDDDFLWMKDYLQLDGVTYKLVPIRTKQNPRNPFEMGRIDSDLMYKNVTSWDWGNSNDPNIYHDPETRRNAITYRSNLARLVETLIQEDKKDKAKEIIDLAMDKMPIEYYEYYTLLEPYVTGYYQVGEKQKARDLWVKIAKKYQERLTYFGSLELKDQYHYAEDIVTNVERYRSVVDLLLINQDREMVEEKADEFNKYLGLFSRLYSADEQYDDDEAIRKQEEDLIKEIQNQEKSVDSLDSIPN
ncbi:glycosyltransferase family 117 protein [Aquimarina sp. 2304DJ70-9]|uniref:glycosyltransferase family 117 protein n=1 Tax=Aquimarina penaris TaxID=3231044 RepID=UPI003462E1FB